MGIRRIEAGILDYGTDMNRSNNPFEMGLGSFIDLKKASFIGKEKLLTLSRKSLFFGVKCKQAIPFAGSLILEKGKVVGQTTVGAFSPLLNTGIGYVLFNEESSWTGKKLKLQDHDKNLHDCEITTIPFYDQSKKIPRGLS